MPPPILYLDQVAWVALARGAADKSRFPQEHAALALILGAVGDGRLRVPLSFPNIYETLKINDPVRRTLMAGVQARISGGCVFRSRRAILGETLAAFLADGLRLERPVPRSNWFLSDVWFESVADLSASAAPFAVPANVLAFIRANPGEALFNYLVADSDGERAAAVRAYSAGSDELIVRLEARRALAAAESLAMRRRVYSARLLLDELNFVFEVARSLGLAWKSVGDIGPTLAKRIIEDIPLLSVERELVVRLEDQRRRITENDLRDMAAFTVAVPFADIIVAEKQFVNLARQGRLDRRCNVRLLTSVDDLSDAMGPLA